MGFASLEAKANKKVRLISKCAVGEALRAIIQPPWVA